MPKYIYLVAVILLTSGCANFTTLVENVDRYKNFEEDIRLDGSSSGVDIDEALSHHGVDGVSIVTIEDGALSSRGFYGYEDKSSYRGTNENTRYQAASLSKMVAGLAMAKADRTGVIKLGRRVSKHVDAHPGQTVSWWYTREFTSPKGKGWASDISVRRLLQNVAGLNKPTTGTSCTSGKTDIENFLGDIADLKCNGCVACKSPPGTEYSYSSGGFVVAEAMLKEKSGREPKEYLKNEILLPYNMADSTFEDGTASISNLARGCDGGLPCDCAVEKAEVKFPGGLLATPLDYARLLTYIINDGEDYQGDEIIPLADIHEVLTPAYHKNSSKASCSSNSACASGDTCFLSKCVTPLKTGADWYGLGVRLNTYTGADGYPTQLHHKGGHDGFTTYFFIDRTTRKGVVIMMNGEKGDDDEGREGLLNDIKDAFGRHYQKPA